MRSVTLWTVFVATLIGLAILARLTPSGFHFGFYLAMASVLVAALVVLAPNGGARNGALALVSILIALTVLEAGAAVYAELSLYVDPGDPKYNGNAPRFWRENPDFGFEPRDASAQVHARKAKNGQLVYDVVYSIDEQRHRVTKGGGTAASCTALFFGDSFVFGEGLGD